MTWLERRRALGAILQGDRCVETGCVFDPVSARIAEEFEVEVGLLSGSIAALVILGAPDIGVATMTEVADLAWRICRAGRRMPVIIDAESGFGNAIDTIRAVGEIERAGAAGFLLEDDLVPEPFRTGGGPPSSSLVSIEEAAGKLRAAVMARGESGLVVLARTNALEHGRLEEAIARTAAYAACGVDGVMLGGRPALQQIEAVASAVKVPLMVISQDPAPRLAELGVRIVHRGQLPFRAAIQATYAAFEGSRAAGGGRALPPPASADLMDRVSSAGSYRDWARQFLGTPPE